MSVPLSREHWHRDSQAPLLTLILPVDRTSCQHFNTFDAELLYTFMSIYNWMVYAEVHIPSNQIVSIFLNNNILFLWILNYGFLWLLFCI